jgi:hypothetical protein
MLDEGGHLQGGAAEAIGGQSQGGQGKITCRGNSSIADIGKIRPVADKHTDE